MCSVCTVCCVLCAMCVSSIKARVTEKKKEKRKQLETSLELNVASLQTSKKRGRTDLPLRGDLTHVQFDASGPQLLWPCILRQSK